MHYNNKLVEESNDLSSDMLATSLLVVHNTSRGREHNVTELTRRQQLDNPFLEVAQLNVVARADDAGLVNAAVELDDNLARAVVVDLLEFTNVAVLLHDGEKLHDDLGARSDHDLALAGLLGVVDRIESVVEDRGADHLGVVGTRFSNRASSAWK